MAVVTRPFRFEGKRRAIHAEAGLEALRECVDTVITIPNERLLSIIDRRTSLNDAFSLADDVLRQAIQGISDLILVPGLINLDFADVKTIMSGMGVAMMGTGTAEGENRAMQAAQKAIASPLLEDGSVNGARGVIINVTGGPDLSLIEVNEASCVIQEAAHEDANIIFGAVVDPSSDGQDQDHRHRDGIRSEGQPAGLLRASDAGRLELLHGPSGSFRRVHCGGPADRGSPRLPPLWRSRRLVLGRRPALDLHFAGPSAPGDGGSPSGVSSTPIPPRRSTSRRFFAARAEPPDCPVGRPCRWYTR